MSDYKIKRHEEEGPVNLYSYFIGSNPPTSFNPISSYPTIHNTVLVGPFSSVIGDVTIDKNVFVGCNATLRADEGTPFYIGPNSNIQDGVIFHGLQNQKFTVNGKTYSIYVGKESTIAHGALIHGPSIVGNKVFVGFNAIVFNAIVEDGCYIDTTAIVTGGIRLHANTYVPIGAIIDTQNKANALGKVPTSREEFAKEVVEVNNEFPSAYALKFGDTRCSCGLCCNKDTIIHD
ncbi:carbonate dehydratase [Clostridium sp.]|uniref:carbonate dehydratase n=1 Tax=Clostridium sp. TaxID=1506 RepID=UPI0032174968